ncbi:transcriptional regulator, AraC family protein [Pedobacter sp. BAL39]|uniref:helix-turn-helix domain-containing protein n=1 Tax=Pedobacter sp. BAL39 TaxID=391596 RepID=UPI00015598E2|nr:helix-turn-helix domain-containing protein [Pedobacter sp. BAL39]EDM37291.1 transcriptional regulator, AraC family protein [Pedobacter sp. BAL39]
MAKKRSVIPTFSMQEKNLSGLEVSRVDRADAENFSLMSAHRDDHYIIMFQEEGHGRMMVDFKEIGSSGPSVMAILPGQVHYGISVEDTRGWVIALDTAWVNEHFRPVLHDIYTEPSPIPLNEESAFLIRSAILLLHTLEMQKGSGNVYNAMLRGATDAVVGIVAAHYKDRAQLPEQNNLRIYTITKQFRSLLMISFRVMKSPSEYAEALNLSPSYLNEAVKQVTGSPVSFWIQQEIILEAKRMLFYTENTVKEIAHALGYQDHTYFIRLFSKVESMPPLQFRQRYRK